VPRAPKPKPANGRSYASEELLELLDRRQQVEESEGWVAGYLSEQRDPLVLLGTLGLGLLRERTPNFTYFNCMRLPSPNMTIGISVPMFLQSKPRRLTCLPVPDIWQPTPQVRGSGRIRLRLLGVCTAVKDCLRKSRRKIQGQLGKRLAKWVA
jgi:hypothetical protein